MCNDVFQDVDNRSLATHRASAHGDMTETENQHGKTAISSDGAGAWVVHCSKCGYAIGGSWSDLKSAKRISNNLNERGCSCPICDSEID